MTPADSTLYFSLKKLAPVQRGAVAAICAFYKEIEDVLFECSDFSVAHAKFNWWRAEIVKQTPDHPVAKELQKIIPQFSLAPEKFIELIDGVEQGLSFATFANFEDVVIHFMRTAGVRELLIYDVVQKNKSVSVETIYQFMLVIELVKYIQYLRRYVRRGLIYFSEDELKKFHVTPALLAEYKTTTEIINLLKFQAEKVERAYAKISAAQTELAFFIVRAKMASATLKEIQASHFCVLENFIDLTPLRKWWTA